MSRILLEKFPEEHPLAHRAGYLLRWAQHAVRLYMDTLLKPLGVTTPQYNVLYAIDQNPGISNASLARGAFVTAQSMVGLVLNLERIGLIYRTDDPDHGRTKRTKLTKKGAAVLAKAHVLLADADEQLMFGFSTKEQNDFRRFLLDCIRNVG